MAGSAVDWSAEDGTEDRERERGVLDVSQELESARPGLKTSHVEVGGSVGRQSW